MTLDEQIAELRRLNYELVALIDCRRRELDLHADHLAGYIQEREAFHIVHPGEALPAVLRYQIEAANNGVEAAKEDIAEWQTGLAEQRAALAAAVGEPLEVFASHTFSFIDQDGAERLCRRNEVHRVPPPAAALAIDASVAMRADSLAGRRAREVATGGMKGPEAKPVRLGDPVGYGFPAD
ncbi:hypothetical protein [Mesorhizobium sp. ES1-1]|uniref:hypothetical protein n=1 Tax=Mesorhizobium sp. ES1-1 TaxID=2876629 RepID=UPI001CC979B4|nr:hypothetical protein [Mesorhizobium sp. ES1-1]MBZ9678234.1 hypothetical protein [Mesorhizobium sp. ES1-1]